jgi:undecaprenyl-diphosphatase
MLDWLIVFDSNLFVFLNTELANPVFDVIMPVATNDWFLRGVLAAIVLGLLIFGGKRGRVAAVLCIVVVALADQISAQILKPLVGRIRPCHVLDTVHLLVNCSQGLSFPSSHAANSVAVATFLSHVFPRAIWYLWAFAVIVSYSRVAVGVHYPLDVLIGALVGALSGLTVILAFKWMARKLSLPPQN